MKTLTRLLLPLALLLGSLPVFAAETEPHPDFPSRELFPYVPVMELEQLNGQFDQVVIVDVRSEYEYDTLHISNALNIPLARRDFAEQIRQLRAETDKPIVFYCNGRTCRKSYKATQKAIRADIDNVFAFDAGIFDWTKAQPDKAVLLGKSPVDPERLIGSDKLKAHMLSPEEFMKYGERDDVIILDVRDRFQREAVAIFPSRQISVALDNAELDGYIRQARDQGKTLLVYDAVGKQVRWLQYHIEDAGVQNYYFMSKGAQGFYDLLLTDLR